MQRALAIISFLMLLSVTAALAEEARTQPVQHVTSHGALQFSDGSEAVLADILLPDPAAAAQWLTRYEGQPISYDILGQDRYGRTSVIARATHDGITLQEELLQQGLAMFYPAAQGPQTAAWLAAENSARTQQRGYWADADRVLTPKQTPSHLRQFVIVEGELTNIYRARDAYYLNFGDRWQDDFSIKIPRKSWHAMEDAIASLEQRVPHGSNARLTADPGHPVRIRVRGTLIEENGPMIVITTAPQLEILRAK